DLPTRKTGFDAIVSGLVLNFVPDPRSALACMRQRLGPGGFVAACVWDYAGKMEMIRAFWDAAASLNPDARDLDEGGRSPICRPENLTNLFREASLSDVETHHLDVPLVFSGFDDYWKPFLGGQGPPGGYVMGLSEKNRDDLRERLSSRLERRSDGSIALTSRAWAVRGIKQ
ncbi:MAG TPA: methyltransferase domain-containing protein, partial [Thermoplasmata archaeon]|nr:methyltransferase domain-containing protein [Thermoplasmata archaeon]